MFKNNKTVSNEEKRPPSVSVMINVTDIVKYASLASVAIIGIIFAPRIFREFSKTNRKEEE